MPFPFVAAALALSGASTAASIVQARKGRKAQARSNNAQREINRLRNFQAKRAFLRQLRQAQADNLSASIAAGVGLESSRGRATRSSQETQAQTSVMEFNRMDELGDYQTSQLNRASRYQFQAGVYGQISNFAQSFISFDSTGGDPRRIPGDDSGAVTTKPSIFNVGAGNG